MTPQEALAQLQVGCLTVWEAEKCFKVVEEALDEGEKAKEILEIIKKRCAPLLKSYMLDQLPKEEYEIIKEWFEK